jgi:hypothetical protein
VHVVNAAQAHVQALRRLAEGASIAGRAYFITNHEPWPFRTIVNRLLAAAGAPLVERRVPPWVGYALGAAMEPLAALGVEPMMTRFLARQFSTAHWFDNTAAKRDLGYVPRVSMEQGFAELATYYASSAGASLALYRPESIELRNKRLVLCAELRRVRQAGARKATRLLDVATRSGDACTSTKDPGHHERLPRQ